MYHKSQRSNRQLCRTCHSKLFHHKTTHGAFNLVKHHYVLNALPRPGFKTLAFVSPMKLIPPRTKYQAPQRAIEQAIMQPYWKRFMYRVRKPPAGFTKHRPLRIYCSGQGLGSNPPIIDDHSIVCVVHYMTQDGRRYKKSQRYPLKRSTSLKSTFLTHALPVDTLPMVYNAVHFKIE